MMEKAQSGCATCKARKIRCDRTLPSCTRCSKTGRSCQGYGMRLFWPKEGDKKRAIVQSSPSEDGASSPDTIEFIHTSTWDFMAYGHLAGSDRSSTILRTIPAAPAVVPPMKWLPGQMSATDHDLLQYFDSTACHSLRTFDQDAAPVKQVLLRLAQLSDTPATHSVRQALLAVASVHRNGRQRQAITYKANALLAMRTSIDQSQGEGELTQHIAAGMLLASYELLSESMSNYWVWFTCGAKGLAKAASLDQGPLTQDEMAVLLSWVHYHVAVGSVSVRHWRGHREPLQHWGTELQDDIDTFTPICSMEKMSPPTGLHHEVLSMLLEVTDNVLEPSDPAFHTDSYREFIKVLEWRIKKNLEAVDDDDPQITPRRLQIIELYQLATLIYLDRSSQTLPNDSAKVKRWVQDGLQIMENFGHCRWPFILFIFGCEAQTDDERKRVLSLVSPVKDPFEAHRLKAIQRLVHFFWTQEDQGAQDLSYTEKIDAVVSISGTVPAFA